MNQPIRILQAFVANDKGGLTGYIIQNYRFIDKNKVQFDFLTFETKKLDFEDEFIALGAKFYHIKRPSRPWDYYKELKKIFDETTYKAVHFNLSYNNFISVYLAKIAGARKIIIHSHSTEVDDKRYGIRCIKRGIHQIGKAIIPKIASYYLACSTEAGLWMFKKSIMHSKNYHLAHNAIDVPKYLYDSQKNQKVREDLGIALNDYVIGHIGRFSYQKNHDFLVRVFKKVLDRKPNAKLVLIGDGPDYDKIKTKVKNLKIEESVLFLGRRNDVPQLLQAIDCFVLPSRFEGLVISGIEAQAAGVPCVVSDVISRELDITGMVKYCSLDDISVWVDSIFKSKKEKIDRKTIGYKGYDIEQEIKKMEQFYLTIN